MKKKTIIGLMLILHGLISSTFLFYIETPPDPGVGWDGTSWLLTGILDAGIIQILGTILWSLTALLFIIAGIALFMMREQWRLLDIFAALVSLLAYVLFWNGLAPVPMYYILGPVISVVTLVALVIVRWPPDEWIYGTQ